MSAADLFNLYSCDYICSPFNASIFSITIVGCDVPTLAKSSQASPFALPATPTGSQFVIHFGRVRLLLLSWSVVSMWEVSVSLLWVRAFNKALFFFSTKVQWTHSVKIATLGYVGSTGYDYYTCKFLWFMQYIHYWPLAHNLVLLFSPFRLGSYIVESILWNAEQCLELAYAKYMD